MRWKTYMAPANYSGAAVWGSNPVIDLTRKSIFVGTGNNYAKPTAPAYLTCVANGGTEGACLSPDDHVDSVVALDLATGAIKWAKRLRSSDDWNTACNADMPGTGNCRAGPGPDYDFASAPNKFAIGATGVVGAGQKSGVYSVFDANTGRLVWAKQVGAGCMVWGSATDGHASMFRSGIPPGRLMPAGPPARGPRSTQRRET